MLWLAPSPHCGDWWKCVKFMLLLHSQISDFSSSHIHTCIIILCPALTYPVYSLAAVAEPEVEIIWVSAISGACCTPKGQYNPAVRMVHKE